MSLVFGMMDHFLQLNLISHDFLLSLVFAIVGRADFSGLGKYLDTIELSLIISKNIVDQGAVVKNQIVNLVTRYLLIVVGWL